MVKVPKKLQAKINKLTNGQLKTLAKSIEIDFMGREYLDKEEYQEQCDCFREVLLGERTRFQFAFEVFSYEPESDIQPYLYVKMYEKIERMSIVK